ncbi:MAG: restriction endonuclease subunit S, partial [Thermomicrobia bacterium]|nr:restriction endonuclease subunit S [Thermomicrobia bacterium]
LAARRAKWEADLRAKGKNPATARYDAPAAPNTDDLPVLPDGWCWTSPEQLASTQKYALAIGPFGSNLKVSDYRESGVPLIFVRNIRTAEFKGPKSHFITFEKAGDLQAHSVTSGDILITKMGDPPGDACLYPPSSPPAIITADCIKWTLSTALPTHAFFVHAINSDVIRKEIQGITQGVAQQKISLERFRTIGVPLPPLTEQERIVAEVERRLSVVQEQETVIAHSLTRSERLRQAILAQAFAGRLVPQDPADEPASALLGRIRATHMDTRPENSARAVRRRVKARE